MYIKFKKKESHVYFNFLIVCTNMNVCIKRYEVGAPRSELPELIPSVQAIDDSWVSIHFQTRHPLSPWQYQNVANGKRIKKTLDAHKHIYPSNFIRYIYLKRQPGIDSMSSAYDTFFLNNICQQWSIINGLFINWTYKLFIINNKFFINYLYKQNCYTF